MTIEYGRKTQNKIQIFGHSFKKKKCSVLCPKDHTMYMLLGALEKSVECLQIKRKLSAWLDTPLSKAMCL